MHRDLDGNALGAVGARAMAALEKALAGPPRCACCARPTPLVFCLSCADAVAAIMTAFDMTDAGSAALLRAILADPDAAQAWARRARRMPG